MANLAIRALKASLPPAISSYPTAILRTRPIKQQSVASATAKTATLLPFCAKTASKPFQEPLPLSKTCGIEELKPLSFPLAANCQAVLKAAGITHLFDTIMDGRVAETLHIPGKPAPDTFLRAAADLAVAPEKAVVFEDAIAGVQAAQQGKFGLVIGVAEPENAQALLDNGANTVVADLGELLPTK